MAQGMRKEGDCQLWVVLTGAARSLEIWLKLLRKGKMGLVQMMDFLDGELHTWVDRDSDDFLS